MSDPSADILRRADKDGLERNEQSPWSGRFRLRGHQVTPNYRPSYDVYLRVHEGAQDEVRGLVDLLEWPTSGLFHIWENDPFFRFSMSSDACAVAEENIVDVLISFRKASPISRWNHPYRSGRGAIV